MMPKHFLTERFFAVLLGAYSDLIEITLGTGLGSAVSHDTAELAINAH